MSSVTVWSLTGGGGELLLDLAGCRPLLHFVIFLRFWTFWGAILKWPCRCCLFCLVSPPQHCNPKLYQLVLQAWRWKEVECARLRQMVIPSLALVFERDFLHVTSAAQKEMKVFLTVNTFLSPPSSALLWVSEDSLHCFSQRRLFLSHLRSIQACPMHVW